MSPKSRCRPTSFRGLGRGRFVGAPSDLCAQSSDCRAVRGPRRGFRRLGGSGGGWPFKIGASPPSESSRALGGPRVDRGSAKSRRAAGWAGCGGVLSFGVARSASGTCRKIMPTTQSGAANAQMLYNQFQRPWQRAFRRCAERFVCQIVGLQGCKGPRRGFRRLGGSGGGWPSKSVERSPFRHEVLWRWVESVTPQRVGRAAGRP